jgi:hypothetical protein
MPCLQGILATSHYTDLQSGSTNPPGFVTLCFAFPDARYRVLFFDLVQQFSKMNPKDPVWLRYKLSAVKCRALENVARGLNDAAAEQARLAA